MNRIELVQKIYNKSPQALPHDVINAVIRTIIEDLDLSIVSLRHAGWISREDHVLYDLDADEEYSEDDWAPVFEVGKFNLGLPPLDLDDVE